MSKLLFLFVWAGAFLQPVLVVNNPDAVRPRPAKDIYLQGKSVHVEQIFALPYRLIKAGSYLIVYDMKGEQLFHVYALQKPLTYLYSFGHAGQGPDEFTLPVVLNNTAMQKDLAVLDLARARLRRFALQKDTYQQTADSDINTVGLSINTAVLTGDKLWAAGILWQGRFIAIDLHSGQHTFLPFIPKLTQDEPGIVYQVEMTADEIYVYSAARFFKRIDKINIVKKSYEKPLVDEVDFDLKKFGGPLNEKNSATMIYYQDIYVTDRYLYALYFGTTDNEMLEHQPTVQVFDKLSGEQLYNLHLDRTVSRIVVDDKQKILLALAADSEDEPLVEFDLGTVFN